MWCQGLKWIHRLNCESEEKPVHSCFQLNLGWLYFSLLLMEGDWGDFIFLGFWLIFAVTPSSDEPWETQSPTKGHHRFILALTGLVYMEALRRVRLELKLGLEWVPFQEDSRKCTKFHCTESLFIFARCTWAWARLLFPRAVQAGSLFKASCTVKWAPFSQLSVQ